MRGLFALLGARFFGIAEVVGGLAILSVEAARRVIPPRLDRFETWRTFHRVGVESLPIVAVTAAFAGSTAVIQSGMYVVRFRAYEIIGWGFGYGVFREVGPLLIGLMFSGRVGAHNTAELGTMQVTEQIDGLRALAIDPLSYLVMPRLWAMVIMMFLLNTVGDLFALLGGITTGELVVGVDRWVFWNSFIEYIKLADFLNGAVKATLFGLSIGLVSCYYGLSVRGGATGVGRAVNNSVVASAVSIFVIDYLITWLLK